jgi:hypothetical protein
VISSKTLQLLLDGKISISPITGSGIASATGEFGTD